MSPFLALTLLLGLMAASSSAFITIPLDFDPQVDLPANFGSLNEAPFGCECSDFMWARSNGVVVGRCLASDQRDGLPLCYLHQPNDCPDAERSTTFPGMEVTKLGCDCVVDSRTGLCEGAVRPNNNNRPSPRRRRPGIFRGFISRLLSGGRRRRERQAQSNHPDANNAGGDENVAF